MDKYIIGEGTQGGNSDEVRVFDLDRNMVKDFTQIGNIKAIEEYNNTIYVISKTVYIYNMDENLNYIVEPQKIEYEGLMKCKDCILAVQYIDSRNRKIILLDNNLQEVREVTTISRDYTLSDEDKFLYYDKYDIYNLETHKELEIYE